MAGEVNLVFASFLLRAIKASVIMENKSGCGYIVFLVFCCIAFVEEKQNLISKNVGK